MAQTADPWTDLSAIVSGAQDAIIGETLDGIVASWNAAAARIFGRTAAEMIGQPSLMLAAGPVDPAPAARAGRGEPVPPFDDRLRHRDGSVLYASVALSPVHDGDGRLLGLSRIIRPLNPPPPDMASHLGRQELAIHRLSRWRAMGQMAAGFAHELNQPLVAVSNYLASARRLLHAGLPEDRSLLFSALDRAAEQTERAAETIRHARMFVAEDDGARHVVSLGATVLEASRLALISAQQAGVAVDLQLGTDAAVTVNPVQMRQALFALMRNAIEAMAAVKQRALHVAIVRGADDVTVSIADTGPGLPPAVAARPFQPFTGTKPDGMGVGLSICRTIVAAHGGTIWFDPAPPRGATVHLRLPLAREGLA